MNIAFMGTTKVAKDILENIYMNGKENISVIVTKEDKIRGRGRKTTPTEVKKFGIEKGIDVLTPKVLDEEFKENLKSYNLDLIIVVAYGKILSKDILDIPKKGCINVHFSLLPKYRGASPVESAILNSETKTGITIMYMNEKMDEGDIISQKEFDILEEDNTYDVFKKATELANDELLKVIEDFENDNITRIKQTGEPTYTYKLSKEMCQIDFNLKTEKVMNIIRAFGMELGARTEVWGFPVKIWKAKKVDISNEMAIKEHKALEKISKSYIMDLPAGKALADKTNLYIKTQNGLIEILEIQAENSKKMDIKAFLNGNINKLSKEHVKIIKN